MKTFKKVLSVVLALSMVLGMMTFTNVWAADADTLYEDFGDGFVISEEGITTTSGLTVTATNEYLTNSKFATTDKGLYVPGGGANCQDGISSNGDVKKIDFTFDAITEGKAEISFDLEIVKTGYSHASNLGLIVGKDAEGVEKTVGQKFWTADSAKYLATDTTDAYPAGKALWYGQGQPSYDVMVKDADNVTDRIRATYVIDMTEKTLSVLVDGEEIATNKIAATVEKIDTIRFSDGWHPDAFYVDDFTICYDANATQKTVSFSGADVESITTTYGRKVTLPVPSIDGQVFGGWKNADSAKVGNAILLTDDIELTAITRTPHNIKEDFSAVTIDSANKTMTSESGLTFNIDYAANEGAATDTIYTVTDGALYVKARQDDVKGTQTKMSFEKVMDGKLYIAFDYKTPYWPSSNFLSNGRFVEIADSDGNSVASLYMNGTAASSAASYYVRTVNNKAYEEDDNTVATFIQDGLGYSSFAKIEYVFDLAEKTYTICVDGGASKTFDFNSAAAADVASIKFGVDTVGTSGTYHYYINDVIDNVRVIEDQKGEGVTITYKNGEDTWATANCIFGVLDNTPKDPTEEDKTFIGWETEDGTLADSDFYAGLVSDVTLYAKYKDIVLINEDFGDGFVISESGVTTTSGLTVTAHADILANAKFKTSENGLYVPGGGSNNGDGVASSGEQKGVDFTFDAITEGKAELSFDLTLVNAGYSHDSHLGQLTGTNTSGATASFGREFQSAGNAKGNSLVIGGTSVTSALNEKIRATYIIDMDKKTVEVLINGVSLRTDAITAATSIDKLRFYDDYNCASYIIDNLTLTYDANASQKTVSFSGADVDAITTTYGRNITLPTPTVSGQVFGGWKNADGKDVSTTYLVTKNETLTAKLRDEHNLVESFESGFGLVAAVLEKNESNAYTGNVTTKGSITTNSGFTFSGKTDNAYGALEVKEFDGNKVLYNNAYCGVGSKISDIYMDFAPIYAGKTYISFELAIPSAGLSNTAFNDQRFFAIGDGEAVMTELKKNYNAVTNDDESKTVTTIVKNEAGTEIANMAESSALHKFEYVIDMDNSTYSLSVDGTAVVTDAAFAATVDSLSRLTFAQKADQNSWYGTPWYLDNVTLVENYTGTVTPPTPPTPATYTVKFYDEDGTTLLDTVEVEEGGTAVFTKTTPTKTATAQYTYTFKGWDGDLTNITANKSVKATYTQTVNKYTVTFKDWDGSTLKTEDVAYGSDATAPTDPTRDDYTFAGWDGTYTNITGTTTITATYTKNPEKEPATKLTSTIEPMTKAAAEEILGEELEDGLYAWKVKTSLSGITFTKSGSRMEGYTGLILDMMQISLNIPEADYYYAMPIASEQTLTAEMDYGYQKADQRYNQCMNPSSEPATSYPYKNGTAEGVEDAMVTLLITTTDTFDVSIFGTWNPYNYYVTDDGEQEWDYNGYKLYSTDKAIVDKMLAKGENYELTAVSPEKLSVADGTVTSGAPAAPETITLLFGDINGDGVISSADGTAIIKSTSGGTKTYKGYEIGKPIGSSGVLFGDINGDGVISSADGTAIIKSTSGGTKTYKGYEIGKDAEFAK